MLRLSTIWSNVRLRLLTVAIAATFVAITLNTAVASSAGRAPVVLISLDGATPRLVNEYLNTGILSPREGLGLLRNHGVMALQNITCSPSLTAACHTTLNSGATTAKHDVVANGFHLVASPFKSNISGFAAPIGGYTIPGGPPSPTAEPIWLGLRRAGKTVVTATFPGGDGADIRLPVATGTGPILQAANLRTVDYTVPFGAFAGVGGKGFSLTKADFDTAPASTVAQLQGAAKKFYSPVLQKKTALETLTVGGVVFDIQVAAIDSTDDKLVNYDTLVFFDKTQGIKGAASLPASTGSAFVSVKSKKNSQFYFEGSSNKAGTAFYVSNLAADLSTVRFGRYSAYAIPRNAPVLANVDDINNNVGFWAPQADFRFPERLNPGLETFPDAELEAIYADQVKTFVDYQTKVALRAIKQNPKADLVMLYIEQPDGSEHQYLLTDPRQATNITDPKTIRGGQDIDKINRYRGYVQNAYRYANKSVQKIIEAVGTTRDGVPKRNVIVVSDHGFAPFHTAVNLTAYLTSKGIDLTKVRAITSGPATNIYISLKGREPDGIVSRSEYITLQTQVAEALQTFQDTNPNYVGEAKNVFQNLYKRPLPIDINDPAFGLGTSSAIGQDGGDVFALMAEGYNFDGTQSPVVPRLGDSSGAVFSVPNFYGAHGYNPNNTNMSAIFFAAGPNIGRGVLNKVRNIDVVPTINQLLGVESAPTVQGKALNLQGRSERRD
jgi:predicted AlkP superfamily pyrophosphatase or phosphodiesterase